MTQSDRAARVRVRQTSSRTDWREDYKVPATKKAPPTVADKRLRAFHSAKDYETSASQIGDIEPFDESIKSKARKVAAEQVVAQGGDAAAVNEMLLMLGIHPSQPDFSDGPVLGPPIQYNTMETIKSKRRTVTQK